ncbi:sensor domain-containing diguanylate cyclase [Vibrio sp. LaRot3]|uniref:sensor domain-containing diguanylate cyclase n=1 Tax=Vibrio sp. LaRot3 TaxID=2998829 RepID=UPI0022CE0443|nr:diguanylate cyclase [Vibrio sp. LaRot3]MDA0149946.1 diguanylate cyclase [Vibrio sp. LaRot3]
MQRKYTFFSLVGTTLTLFFLASLYYVQEYYEVKSEIVRQTGKDAIHQLIYSEREYESLRSQFISVTELLSHSRSLFDYANNPNASNKVVVEEMWRSVLKNQHWYSQLRFLDTSGVEKIRLNHSQLDSISTVATVLQDKSQRDYFAYAQTLENEQIGSWGIDLEMENGAHVQPYTPALRVMTPVSSQGERLGYLLLNVDVWYLASRLNYSPDQDFRPTLINPDGFYLANEDSNYLFGHILPERQEYNIANHYPVAWQEMTTSDTESGYVVEKGGIVAYKKMHFMPNTSLYLTVILDQKRLVERSSEQLRALRQEASLVFILVLAFAVPATWALLYYRNRSNESQLARAALNGMSAVLISDRYHRAIMINDEFTRLTGYSAEQLKMKNVIKLLMDDDHIETMLEIFETVTNDELWEGEVTLATIRNDRAQVIALMRTQRVLSKVGRVSYYITSLVDISERKELENRLRILSEKDELTQLWNRRKFEIELRQSARVLERYPEALPSCLALLDIDYFKRVNDDLGHDEGDRVISQISAIMVDSLRDTDFIARIGGEEFAVIMPQTSVAEAEIALNRLRIIVEMSEDVPVTISIGLTDLTGDNTRCYKCADIALYESKAHGRNRVSICYSSDDIA